LTSGPPRAFQEVVEANLGEEHAVAEDSMTLLDVLRKEELPEGDFLREAVHRFVHELMEAEVTALVGAGPYERTEERTGQRNGHRSRRWDTRVGTLELAIPKLRTGSYFPSWLEPRRRSERALVAVVAEAYVQGVSTGKVEALVQFGADGVGGVEQAGEGAGARGAVVDRLVSLQRPQEGIGRRTARDVDRAAVARGERRRLGEQLLELLAPGRVVRAGEEVAQVPADTLGRAPRGRLGHTHGPPTNKCRPGEPHGRRPAGARRRAVRGVGR
jgi:hypothetical protein